MGWSIELYSVLVILGNMRKMIYVTFIYFFQFLSLSFSFLLDPFPHLTLLGSAPRVSRPGDESRSPSWRRRVPRPTLGPWEEGGQRLAPTADARRRECIHGCGSPRPSLAAGEVAHPAPDARPLGGGQAAARPHGRRSSPGRHPWRRIRAQRSSPWRKDGGWLTTTDFVSANR
ncbi:hypothetical protein GQ55_2G046200 [Panicum hallii var. hallii]|uniref:Uncharacterized protein n=1 Tax=Panicum hallii var. hallii TaxID=1504633 RepID=A0A2T7ELD6_9POAL|nr:hypothetical protein GQ55_2G046200 [Panicum hallii var. hallii]